MSGINTLYIAPDFCLAVTVLHTNKLLADFLLVTNQSFNLVTVIFS